MASGIGDGFPEPLRAISAEVSSLRLPISNLDSLRPVWAAHVARAREQIRDLCVDGEGEILHLGALAPGCQSCKEGAWDCVFTTMRCNLDCGFCYSPHAIPKNYSGSCLGSSPQEIAQNHARTRITGISFSGGEPFAEPEKLFEWVAWFTSRHPERTYWVYTNGLLADAARLRRLAELGVDEIRFNLAATGYDHPTVLDNLAAAVRFFPNVTVEIPAIPQHGTKLLASLTGWSALGVRFLNMHELMYEPGTNSAAMPGARWPIVTADGHCSAIHPRSRALTLAVMQRVQEKRLHLAVNDCSLQSKLRQLRGRRVCLAPLAKAPHEKLLRGEAYESYCAYRDGGEVHFFHPDTLDEMSRRFHEHRFVRLLRSAPLAIDDPGRWIACDPLARGSPMRL